MLEMQKSLESATKPKSSKKSTQKKTTKNHVPTRPLPSPSHLDHHTKLRANPTHFGVPTKGAALFIEIGF